MSNLDSVVAEAVKAAPPLAVTAATFMGLTLQEWVYVATLVYTLMQLYFLIKDRYFGGGNGKGKQ